MGNIISCGFVISRSAQDKLVGLIYNPDFYDPTYSPISIPAQVYSEQFKLAANMASLLIDPN